MRYISVIFLALLITGCIKKSSIEFTGTIPGVKNGVFIVKTTGDSTIYGENIKGGKFTLTKRPLKEPGYYMMNIVDQDNNDNHSAFEVYLEGATYSIETEEGKLYKYPKITTSSKTQQELSAFYIMLDKLSLETQQEVQTLNNDIKTKGNSLSSVAYSQLLNKLSAAKASMATSNETAFKDFVKEFPNSDISAHLMTKLDYEEDPASYYAIFKTLSAAAKNSDDGKEIGDKLSHLINLVEGATAPAIAGKMLDGKTFDPKSISKKLVLIDFWRASNEISRRNHQTITNILEQAKYGKNLAVVSISLDTKKDWWTGAIIEDNINWPQICDLKGDDSPNAVNWNITKIPTYYLLDGNWKIVRRDIDINSVNFEVDDYMNKKRHN
ncbi:thioredoxin-like protein [Mucilaginibacter frigoritolerans]|uniref:Thioredoxin-like protein n=1 Tax=Mucilaginibacter frigoritolerans TaxID=652788 RepID=A0A562UAA9_9SPHI|nr:thioredoxin-like domain-containing protein [Mucilaginibacter frigoritolerans]TWJ02297.1 thioredoxin-like protein [Mucilaginibacter frigoritolerans]